MQGMDPNPAKAAPVKLLLRGAQREHGAPPKRKAALRTAAIAQLVTEGIDRSTLQGKRDAALILVGYAGAFRRSELVAVSVDHLRFEEEGVAIFVPWSKTEHSGEGKLKGIQRGANAATCPVTALRQWLEAAEIKEGPVFRGLTKTGATRRSALSDGAVASILKRVAECARIDPKTVAGHSLRSGFVTEMIKQHAADEEIMAQTFHASREQFRTYYREAKLFERSPTRLLGL